MEKFPGEVEIFNKENLEQKFPNLEEEAYRENLCKFAERIFIEENFVGYGKTANVYKYPDEETGLCFKYIYNLLPGNHDLDIEIDFMAKAKSEKTKVRVPQAFASIASDLKIKEENGRKRAARDRVLVMEYINGKTLQEFKAENLPLPENFNAETFFDELGAYVEELHEKKIYHRDLHDKNVMIDTDTGLPVVIDFGRAYQSHLSDESEKDIYASEEPDGAVAMLPNDNEYFQKLKSEYKDYLTR